MRLSVMYWNIWLKNQINGLQSAEPFLNELTHIINTFQPDCIGLNEVLQHKSADAPFVLDHLKKLGYSYTHFALASPFTEEWLIGAGLASKYKLEEIAEVALSKDVPAQKRGFEKCTVKAITAKVILPENKAVNFIVAHPLYVRPHTIRVHLEATQKLKSLMSSKEFSKNTILGGDFNESIYWPHSFHKTMRGKLNFKSGSIVKPTWLHNAKPWTPIRANLDQLFWTRDENLSLQDFKVINSKLSDHRPLFAQFEVT